MIWDIKKYAIHDGPGIRTTVFFKGCPLRCIWCCNPESQSFQPKIVWIAQNCIGCRTCLTVCPTGAILDEGDRLRVTPEACNLCDACCQSCPGNALDRIGKDLSVSEILMEIDKDAHFHQRTGGGLTLSGGEPLAQPELAFALLKQYRDKYRGGHTAVETCAHADWAVLKKMIPVTDLFMIDLKHMNSEKHKQLTGAGNETILNNIRRLAAAAGTIVIRFPLVPGCNDEEDNLRQTADFVGSLKNVNHLDILPYHRLGEPKYERLGKLQVYREKGLLSLDLIERVRRVFENYGIAVRIGG